ncbi:MAG TPA: DMT family transporter [Deltaproteobacteria bacterium]|nr:DMT family transporter [Deltaproteobacteria bacterium]
MITAHLLGVIFALTSAVSWGTGDFSGGFATRRQHQFQVVFLMTIPGIVILAFIALAVGEPFPPVNDALWATSAGASGALGIAALYRGLSLGNAATVAPTAAVIGAGVPIVFSSLFIGLPGIIQVLGFVLALVGIWFVSRPPGGYVNAHGEGLVLAVMAGIGFGVFFLLIAQVRDGLVFGPLVFAKTAALVLACILILSRKERIPGLGSNPIAILAGVFDAGGNAFFMLAKQFTRLDIAAVLASMYPAVTVILAFVLLRERVTRSQWLGVMLCILAIALIGI